MPDLYDFLQRVRGRPGPYLRDKSLDELEILCGGYAAALAVHGIKEFGTHFNQNFANFLLQRRGWSMCTGWARGIVDHSASAEAAWDRFFELLDQFKTAKRVADTDGTDAPAGSGLR